MLFRVNSWIVYAHKHDPQNHTKQYAKATKSRDMTKLYSDGKARPARLNSKMRLALRHKSLSCGVLFIIEAERLEGTPKASETFSNCAIEGLPELLQGIHERGFSCSTGSWH